MLEIILYPIVGLVSGFMAGLFGVGGGLVIVPVLLIIFEIKGFDSGVYFHMAVATSLAAIIVNGITATYTQHKRQAVDWQCAIYVPALMLGALTGALVASGISGNVMRYLLAGFLLAMAVYMLVYTNQVVERVAHPRWQWLVQLVCFGIGGIASIVGIAGGTFLVPLLSSQGRRMQVAVGTSSALGVPLVLLATVGHIYSGFSQELVPQWSLGYVYIPAFIGIFLVSPIGARLGVCVSHRLEHKRLKRIYGVFLLLNGSWVLGSM